MDELEKLARELYEAAVQFPDWEREQEHLRESYRAKARDVLQKRKLMAEIKQAVEDKVIILPPGDWKLEPLPQEDRFPPTAVEEEAPSLEEEVQSKLGLEGEELPQPIREELDKLKEVSKRSRGRKKAEP